MSALSLKTKSSLIILPLCVLCIVLTILVMRPLVHASEELTQLQALIAQVQVNATLAKLMARQSADFWELVSTSSAEEAAQFSQGESQIEALWQPAATMRLDQPDEIRNEYRKALQEAKEVVKHRKVVRPNDLGGRVYIERVLSPLNRITHSHQQESLDHASRLAGFVDNSFGTSSLRAKAALTVLDVSEFGYAQEFAISLAQEIANLSRINAIRGHNKPQTNEEFEAGAFSGETRRAFSLLRQEMESDQAEDFATIHQLETIEHQYKSVVNLERQILQGSNLHQDTSRQTDLLEQNVNLLQSQLDVLTRLEAGQLSARLKDVSSALRFALILTFASGSMIVVFGIAAPILVSRKIIRPISELRLASARLAVGNFDSPVLVESGDELGDLGHAFNTMAKSITTAAQEREVQMQTLATARDVAEAATRAKSTFLANMSHEIRTPLNGVMGMTDLTLETELTAEQKEYLDTIKLSADSLLTVLNDILDFSKIEAGKIELEAIDFNLRDFMENTLKTLALRADEKGLELLCEISPEAPEAVGGDSNRLRQILVNLVSNAIKFTDRGEIALKVQPVGGDARNCVLQFSVVDTGIGISEDKLRLIFEPFGQADSSTTRKYGGTGLGLTISTRLAEMMGGKIWVESIVGRGTQFHFTAQFHVAEWKPVEVGSIAPPELLRGVKVLVVDDNRTNCRILEGMLQRWEMKHTSVDGVERALGELSAARNAGEPYGLILTDMHMPEMDGFTFIERIRERPELATTTIMMLTSAGHRGDAVRCQELGVAAYLLKPIRQSELREAIARALGAAVTKGAIPLITRYSLQDSRDPSAFLHVLLAEDNLVNQRLATRLLEKRGHRVTVAGNGRDVLLALEKESYDLIFMDLQMPEMDGFEATAAIRESELQNGTHQHVIALTAHAMSGDRERCKAAGMDGYLTKPIRPLELDELLQHHVDRRMLLAAKAQTAAAAIESVVSNPQRRWHE